MSDFLKYFIENIDRIMLLFLNHIQYTFIAVFIAILIGVPLGIIIYNYRALGRPILTLANVVQAIPSLALVGFLVPSLGIGETTAIIMVVTYSLLPILKNTYTGLSNIDDNTLEAAKGIGMTRTQVLFKVQIPIALPVIMAGIRISSVTAVGLMTIAAYVGADVLGTIVIAGINVLSTVMILSGAIPACLLAITMDFIMSKVEKAVTPISLQISGANISQETIENMRTHKKRTFVSVGIVLVIVIGVFVSDYMSSNVTMPVVPSDDGTEVVPTEVITIGSKESIEGRIIGHIMAEAIEQQTNHTVERRMGLGGTQIAFTALETDEIDIYPEYTGSLLTAILGDTYVPGTTEEAVYDQIKANVLEEYNLYALPEFGFNNRYVLSVMPETAEQYSLETVSDLAAISSGFMLGCSSEFSVREDGLLGLNDMYGTNFADIKVLTGSLMYTAVAEGDVEVITAFSTDSLMGKYNLVALDDDKNFFSHYEMFPLVNERIVNEHPEVVEVLAEIVTLIDDETMIELNSRASEDLIDAEVIAYEFLLEHGYVKTEEKPSEVITIGSKESIEGRIIGHIMAEAIEQQTNHTVERRMGLGGTQIAFTALETDEIDIYPEYTGSLLTAILGDTYVPGTTEEAVYDQIKANVLEEYNLYALPEFGFNNRYVLSVMPETAEQYSLETVSDLAAISSGFMLGCSSEFSVREDGLLGLNDMYGTNFADIKVLTGSLMYTAVAEGDVEVITAFSTDSLMGKYNLVALDDDKNFFSHYEMFPLVNERIATEHPEILAVLAEIVTLIDDAKMVELNSRASEDLIDAEVIAYEFLLEEGYVTNPK